MTLILENKQINKEKWDHFVENSVCAKPYLYSWYLDIVAPGWKLLQDPDNNLTAPLPVRKKFGLQYVFQPKWVQQIGVFHRKNMNVTIEEVRDFLKKLPANIPFLHYNLNHCTNLSDQLLNNFELDLSAQYSEIYKHYKTNLKRNLKKAQKAGLSIREASDPEQIINTFQNQKGNELKHLSEGDYQNLRALINRGIKERKIKIREVHDASALVGGAVFLNNKQTSVFLFSALSEKGREKRAMPFLLNSYIEENAGNNRKLDFEGSQNPNLARFYQSFGAKNHPFPVIKWCQLPLINRTINLPA